jgi:predicted MFS family arabinose efflux permease
VWCHDGRVVPDPSPALRHATLDARRVLGVRGLRGLVDGLVSVVLPTYLGLLGLSAVRIGLVSTATLVGSAVLTMAVALGGGRWRRRSLLLGAGVLMIGTGLGFAASSTFAAVVVVGFLGTLNPTSGDVSVFLPTEQALLPQTIGAGERTALFARYALAGTLAVAFGSLAAGLPGGLARWAGASELAGLRGAFVAYAVAGLATILVYRHLSAAAEPPAGAAGRRRMPLVEARSVVTRLAALFSLDAFAGGFTVQSMVALWLSLRFGLSVATTGAVFFWTGLLTACSMPLSARLARRFGLINTMVFTHLPAQVFLIAAAFMPTAPLAVGFLLARSALAAMDVPARTSYVMAVVPPGERAAAAGVTNVPRSLVSAAGPALSGWLLSRTTFGWPLLIAGALKITYDLLLLAAFRHVRPPEEEGGATVGPDPTEPDRRGRRG